MAISKNRLLNPSVSFVVATHNRGLIAVECLRRTIACAQSALGPGRFDLIVVDNASTDATAEQIADLARELAAGTPDPTDPKNSPLKLIRLPRNCGPVAKNAGLEANPADIIVILDDDACPRPGALAQMVRHFQDDDRLGAAVFDVSLPDGAKEASAYPDVFIGAGTAFRGEALRTVARSCARGHRSGILPWNFFMQAEEYDLSFRLLAAGWTIQRFWDMPLLHLKTPGARIGERTTRLDVKNNLLLLAKYLPQPLCMDFASEWLTRYFRMALCRDRANQQSAAGIAQAAKAGHRAAFINGAAQGLKEWDYQRGDGRLILSPEILERVFRFQTIRDRLIRAKSRLNLRRIAFGDWGKNIFPFWKAAQDAGLEVTAIIDGKLALPAGTPDKGYRGVPVIPESAFQQGSADAVIITAMSPVHAARRSSELRRLLSTPVIDLFSHAAAPSATGLTDDADLSPRNSPVPVVHEELSDA